MKMFILSVVMAFGNSKKKPRDLTGRLGKNSNFS